VICVQCSLSAIHGEEDGNVVVAAEKDSKIKQSIADLLSYCHHRRSSWHLSQGFI